VNTSGTLIGKIPAGTETYIQNAGLIWLVFLVPLAVIGWMGMNNIRDEHVSPDIPNPLGAFSIILGMLAIGFVTAAFGLWLLLPGTEGGLPTSGLGVSKWIVLPIVITLTVLGLKMIPGAVGQNLSRQYKIFGNKHTWAMTVIYTMTFLEVDGLMTHNTVNPNGPSALMFAWMGPFIGALIRPIGGMWADKAGGAKVTQIISIVMVASALGVAYFIQQAYSSASPEQYFYPFLGLFLILFAATGIGNGSTFRTIAVVFNKEQAGPALGWTAAVAAYGAFIIPKVFGEQLKAGSPEYALYGFAIFYAVCIVINWWFYLRPNAYIKNP
jgi:NNP family nitrate/nitrite transporter-like MFS transporter